MKLQKFNKIKISKDKIPNPPKNIELNKYLKKYIYKLIPMSIK